jgi:hypothetical protein
MGFVAGSVVTGCVRVCVLQQASAMQAVAAAQAESRSNSVVKNLPDVCVPWGWW